MKYLVVDDEKIILEGMEDTLKEIVGDTAAIYKASDPYEAIEQMKLHTPDIVFSDVDMPYLDWIIENTGNDCEWEISWHSKADSNRINSFVFDRPRISNRVNKIQMTEVSYAESGYIQKNFHFLHL